MAKKATKKPAAKKTTAKKSSKKAVEVGVQPVVNIGLFGHVDHGKTTLTQRLSGKWTDTHSEEIKRGITIRLGYADASFKMCGTKYTTENVCPDGSEPITVRKVSFVDAPGHESLMATMLAGATIIDGALLLISANEECPQPQTKEHLTALQIMGVQNLVIVQNKIDLVSEEQAVKNYNQIKEFIKGTPFENSPIIPVSARLNVNIDLLIQAIEDTIPTPERDSKLDPMFFVARSFDINKPGTPLKELKGGVLGGSLKQGMLKVGDEIEIRPGYSVEERNQTVFKPITTKITSIVTGGSPVEEIVPGGSVAVLTQLDPSVIKSDKFTGSIAGLKGKLPPVWYKLKLETHLLDRVVGAKDSLVVEPLKHGEMLMLNVNSAATVGVVQEFQKNSIICPLKIPVCAEPGARVTISRRVGNRFRLIGYGVILE